jgi:hypothetical protein
MLDTGFSILDAGGELDLFVCFSFSDIKGFSGPVV